MLSAARQIARQTKITRAISSVRTISTNARRNTNRMTPFVNMMAPRSSKCTSTNVHTIARRHMETEAIERDSMEYDVLIVGGGPAGLASAIRLKQLANEKGMELNVCLIDKGAEIGAHILSGNVFQPTYLTELIPDWKERDHPLTTPVTSEDFYVCTKFGHFPTPIPPVLHNEGNYIISLGALCKFLAEEAEALGVEIYSGFAAAQVIYGENGAVEGVITGDVGIGKDGQPTENFAPGMELRAKQTFFAEGTRGSCSEEIIQKFNLSEGKAKQTYGIGLKEIWEISPEKAQPGRVFHTVGHPLPSDVYGGSFVYHMQGNLVHLGIVIGLDYENPYLNPYQEFQRWKHSPLVKDLLEGGKCISYGARALNEGGYQAVPKLAFPGGALLGCSAGFINVPKVKGSHNAMKSGMEAAEALFMRLDSNGQDIEQLQHIELTEYITRMENGPVMKELYEVRNIRPAFKFGQLGFLANAGLELFITRGKGNWTIAHHEGKDCDQTGPKDKFQPIEYPKPDGKISFNLLENLSRTGVNHDENQPSHLKIKPGMEHMPKVSYETYAAPESRFCPAGVYEYLPQEDGSAKLQINAQNCIHCKTCSIKTPSEFIKWTVPHGGEGPAYQNM